MNIFKRLFFYVMGVFFIALGSVVAIESRLGVSPISSLPFSINRVSGVSIGMASVVLFCMYVLIQIILLKKDFKKIQLLQVVFAVMFGKAVDLLNNVINIQVNNFIMQLGLSFVSTFIIAIGIVMIIKMNIVPLAPEGLVGAISSRFGIEFGKVKIRLDCVVVSTSIILLLASGNNLEGIGIGTIIAAMMVGKIVQIINKILVIRQTKKVDIDNVDLEPDDKDYDFREA